ncbi:MAG: adenosylcobinamide-GDP ribazoletransferase [Campylobacterota bacterium]|nr:adenosylcobinamide-GDP ribazoletransferase [Campylobacterota bacterium]
MKQKLNDYWNPIKFGISYFSILPVKVEKFEVNKNFYQGVLLSLPLVGFVLALIVSFIHFILFTDLLYGAFLCAMIYVFLTGFLHLEAVADTVDGWYASLSQKDVYAIMHEPHVGAIGAIGTFCIVLLLLAGLTYALYYELYLLVFLSLMLSRVGVYFALEFDFHPKSVFVLGLKNAVVYPAWLKIIAYPLVLLVGLILKPLKKRLGFLNGDTLGFMIVLLEIIVLNIGIVLC